MRPFLEHAGGDARPVVFDVDATYPSLQMLRDSCSAIQREMEPLLAERARLPTYVDLDPTQASISPPGGVRSQWRVFMLRTFSGRIEENARQCPVTSRMLDTIPFVTQAFFSVLEPRCSIPPHEGPNTGCLRYHLGIKVPASNPPRLRIKDQEHVWREGEGFLFDDTWEHEVRNECTEVRVILVVDVLRPMPPHLHAANYLLMFVGGRLYGRGVIERGRAYGG